MPDTSSHTGRCAKIPINKIHKEIVMVTPIENQLPRGNTLQEYWTGIAEDDFTIIRRR